LFSSFLFADELEIARSFLLDRDPYGALYTLKRHRYQNPSATTDPEFLLLEGLSYLYVQDSPRAQERFDRILSLVSSDSPYFALATLEKAESAFFQGMVEDAWRQYLTFARMTTDPFLRSYTFYKAGWSALLAGDLEGAHYGFSQGGEGVGIPATTFTFHLERLKNLPSKSPGLALGLSILPGLGQLYAGNPGDAISAFLVNGLFALATIALAREGERVLAFLVGGVGLVWYGGNLYSAWEGARTYNERIYEGALESFKREALLHYQPLDRGKRFFLRYGVDFR
jgi:TM2 domain-containing membrane protein YozV